MADDTPPFPTPPGPPPVTPNAGARPGGSGTHPAKRSRVAAAAISTGALVGLVAGVAVAGSRDDAGAQDRAGTTSDRPASPGSSDQGSSGTSDDGSFSVPAPRRGGPSWGDPSGGSATPYSGGSAGGPVTRSGGS